MGFRNVFSSSNAGSWSRTGSFIALLCSCAWVTWVVYKKVVIPELGGVTLFVTSLYGLGKINETVQAAMVKPPTVESTKTEKTPDGTTVVQATKTVDAVKLPS